MHLFTASAALLLGLLGAAQAHTVPRHGYINGVSPGMGVCLRLSEVGWNSDPVKVSSDEMACGIDGQKGAARTCPVKGGDTITYEYFHHRSPEHNHDYLHYSHAGPCSVMMKKVDSAVKDPAVGDGWFRIAYEGYNNETRKWCTERVVEEGRISAVLPTDLPGGDYLVRFELLALHAAADRSNPDPQFYVSCMQVFLDSAGSGSPTDTVAIPSEEYANLGMPAMTWNIWDGTDNATYPDYGPPTYRSSGQVDPNAKFEGTQTDGLRPTNCLLEVRNFFFTPEPSYTDREGCWKANENCWDQLGALDSSPFRALDSNLTSGLWAKRCDARAKECESGNLTPGPETTDFTPPGPTIVPPPPFDTSNGSGNPRQSQSGTGSSSSSTNTAIATATATTTPTATPTATSTATTTADTEYGAPSNDVKVENESGLSPGEGESSSVEAPQPTETATALPAAEEDDETCVSVITDTVTEMVTVTATQTATATVDAAAY